MISDRQPANSTRPRIEQGVLELNNANHPLIIAHRAMTPGALENAPSSLRRLERSGADLVEMDIRISLDRKPFVIHDAFIGRITHAHGWVQIWPSFLLNRIPLRDTNDGDHVASLRKMLDVLPTGLQPALHIKDRAALPSTLRTVLDHGDPVNTWLWLDHAADVTRAIGIIPGIRCTLLRPSGWKPEARSAYMRDAQQTGTTAISLPWGVIDRDLVDLARSHDLRVFTRQGDPALISTLLALGIDGIVTDDPAATARLVGAAR